MGSPPSPLQLLRSLPNSSNHASSATSGHARCAVLTSSVEGWSPGGCPAYVITFVSTLFCVILLAALHLCPRIYQSRHESHPSPYSSRLPVCKLKQLSDQYVVIDVRGSAVDYGRVRWRKLNGIVTWWGRCRSRPFVPYPAYFCVQRRQGGWLLHVV